MSKPIAWHEKSAFEVAQALQQRSLSAQHYVGACLDQIEAREPEVQAFAFINPDLALARAKASGKRVLIKMGGNWCGDCRILQATMDLPEMKTFLNRNFEMISVDVGRMDKNLQIPARYGVTTRLEGVPAIFVVDPKSGQQLVGKAQIADLADARHMQPQDLANWLARYTK